MSIEDPSVTKTAFSCPYCLDIVRAVGNEAVHPGQLDLVDDKNTAFKLFDLINLIFDVMITQKLRIKKMYDNLPDNKKKHIDERDNK